MKKLALSLPLYFLAAVFVGSVFAQVDPASQAGAAPLAAPAPPIPLDVPEWLVAMITALLADTAMRAKRTKKAASLFYLLRDVLIGLAHFCEAIGKALDRVLQRTKEPKSEPSPKPEQTP